MTSKVLCQGEKGRDSLHFVFVGEDGEEDAVHRGSVLEDAGDKGRCGGPTGATAETPKQPLSPVPGDLERQVASRASLSPGSSAQRPLSGEPRQSHSPPSIGARATESAASTGATTSSTLSAWSANSREQLNLLARPTGIDRVFCGSPFSRPQPCSVARQFVAPAAKVIRRQRG